MNKEQDREGEGEEIIVQFDKAMIEAIQDGDAARAGGKEKLHDEFDAETGELGSLGGVGLPEIASKEELAAEDGGNEDDHARVTSDMRSVGNKESDEGVVDGFAAGGEADDSIEDRPPQWREHSSEDDISKT